MRMGDFFQSSQTGATSYVGGALLAGRIPRASRMRPLAKCEVARCKHRNRSGNTTRSKTVSRKLLPCRSPRNALPEPEALGKRVAVKMVPTLMSNDETIPIHISELAPVNDDNGASLIYRC